MTGQPLTLRSVDTAACSPPTDFRAASSARLRAALNHAVASAVSANMLRRTTSSTPTLNEFSGGTKK
jgi:hypothetical protein